MAESNERYRAHKAKRTGGEDEAMSSSEQSRQGMKRREHDDQSEEQPEYKHVENTREKTTRK